MSLFGLLIFLVVVGFLLWLVTTFIPMDPRIKQVIMALGIVIIVIVVIYALFQFLGGGPVDLRIRR